MFELGKQHEKLQSVHLHFLINCFAHGTLCLHCTNSEWLSLTDINDQRNGTSVLKGSNHLLPAGEVTGVCWAPGDLWVLWFEESLCSRHWLWHAGAAGCGVLWGIPFTSLMGKELLENFVLLEYKALRSQRNFPMAVTENSEFLWAYYKTWSHPW